jgi:hypothetical protein
LPERCHRPQYRSGYRYRVIAAVSRPDAAHKRLRNSLFFGRQDFGGDRVFLAYGCGWAGCGSEEIPGFARKLGDAGRRWLRAKLRGYWYLRGVIDEFKSRSAISSFMKGDPVRADLGDRENVGGAGESTNKVACIKVILS